MLGLRIYGSGCDTMGQRDGNRDSNAGRTTVKISLDGRDILKVAAARRRVSMVDLLDELLAQLAEEPPKAHRKPARKRARASA